MVRRRPAPKPAPDREDILAFIAEHGSSMGQRELLHAMGLKGRARTEAKRTLRVIRKETGFDGAADDEGDLPAVGIADVISLDNDGEPILKAARNHDVTVRLAPNAKMAPGIGDRILTRFTLLDDGSYRADPIKLLPNRPRDVMGIAEKSGNLWRLRTLGRQRSRDEWDLLIGPDHEVEHGDLVQARADRSGRFGRPRATLLERLGRPDNPSIISLATAVAAKLPMTFSVQAREDARAAKPVTLGQRRDLRDLDLVTIDGDDAKDFDDAVWAQPDSSTDNEGGFQIVVAIADVAHYVRPGTALDREARERGNSVYFPDRVIPMLPEELSNDLCSLRPDEDRACLAVEMRIGKRGRLIKHRFVRGLMRSRARLTYDQVQAAHDGSPDASTEPLARHVIEPLFAAYEALDAARKRRGTIELDLPERRVVLDEDGRPTAIEPRKRLASHCLIEEFMIAANVAAALELGRRRQPFLYRAHDKPDAVKLDVLAQYLKELDVPWDRSTTRPADFSKLLRSLRSHDLYEMIASFVLRAQAQAVYQPENIGHFGLNLKAYTHFTSPIRRYSDLVVHRALIQSLNLPGAGGRIDDEDGGMASLGEHLSGAERRAMEAERKAHQKFVSLLMSDKVGAQYDGRVICVHRFGLFEALSDCGAEGLVPVSSLGDDMFVHDERQHVLIGRRSGEAFGLGDRVNVELIEADRLEGQLLFAIREHQPGVHAQSARSRKDRGGPLAKRHQRPRNDRPLHKRRRRA